MPDEEKLARIRYHLYEAPIAVIMEYMPCGSYADKLGAGRTSPKDAVADVLQICQALAIIHQSGNCHRDIKLANVLLRPDGSLVLSDLGLAARFDTLDPKSSYGHGTLRYMAPEQLDKHQTASVETDIWAVGVLLYKLVSGTFPFDFSSSDMASEIEEVIRRIRTDPVQSLRVLNSCMPETLDKICQKCLQKDKSNRYRSVSELTADLAIVLKDFGSVSAPLEPSRYAWHPFIYTSIAELTSVVMLLNVEAIKPSTAESISALLKLYRCNSHRVYQVFGRYDFVVRGVLPDAQLRAFTDALSRKDSALRPVVDGRILPYNPAGAYHWSWKEFQSSPIPVELIELESKLLAYGWEFSRPGLEAISKKWIRVLKDEPGNIIFFVFILSRVKDGNLSLDTERHLIATLSGHSRLALVSFCRLDNPEILAIAKAETSAFPAIQELVRSFNEFLAETGLITMTCVLADLPIVGEEKLNARDLNVPGMVQQVYRDFVVFAEKAQKSTANQSVVEATTRWLGRYGLDHDHDYQQFAKQTVENVAVAILEEKMSAVVSVGFQLLYSLATALGLNGPESQSENRLVDELNKWHEKVSQNGGRTLDKHVTLEQLAKLKLDLQPAPLTVDGTLDMLDRILNVHESVWRLSLECKRLGLNEPFSDESPWW